MYTQIPGRKQESPLTLRTFCIALALHVAAGVALWGLAKIVWRTPEVIIPIDMTIVPPWAEVDPDDPEPDPNPPPEPKQEQPKPQPKPKIDPPKVDDVKQDAVVKETEKPKPKKPEFKKAALKKPEKKPEEKKPEEKKPKIKPGDFKKNAKLHKNIPKNVPRTGKGTAKEKPLSQAEILKALNADARYGSSNQLAANEEQRCISLVASALKRHWTEEFQWNDSLRSVHLELHLGAGGSIKDARIVRSSGDAQVDKTVLLAAKNTGSIPGLSQAFLDKYPVFVIEMKPTAR